MLWQVFSVQMANSRRFMHDDTAIILMVDSNCQREHILPSEKAKAYQMKLEAIKRKGGRPLKIDSGQLG